MKACTVTWLAPFVLLAAAGLRAQTSLPRGITPAIQTAIDTGRDWLVGQQAPNGSWRAAGGHGTHPVSMTSLAGMALLCGGSTPTRGRHCLPVRNAVTFLKQKADGATGLIAVRGEDHQPMFGHGFATLLLASVFGMEEDVRAQEALKGVLDRAVGLTSAAQSAAGGWIYFPGDNDDEGSVTITQLQALRACRMAGIVVDKRTIDRAVDYLRRCQNPDGGIRYKLMGSGSSRPAITAAGVAAMYVAGAYDDDGFVQRAVSYCHLHITAGTDGSQHGYYTQHYWTQALWQRGGDEWATHFDKVSAWLLREQRADGSWHGDGVGAVYGTAVALTILQLPYTYVPIYQR
jgi:hypothetical protein